MWTLKWDWCTVWKPYFRNKKPLLLVNFFFKRVFCSRPTSIWEKLLTNFSKTTAFLNAQWAYRTMFETLWIVLKSHSLQCVAFIQGAAFILGYLLSEKNNLYMEITKGKEMQSGNIYTNTNQNIHPKTDISHIVQYLH